MTWDDAVRLARDYRDGIAPAGAAAAGLSAYLLEEQRAIDAASADPTAAFESLSGAVADPPRPRITLPMIPDPLPGGVVAQGEDDFYDDADTDADPDPDTDPDAGDAP